LPTTNPYVLRIQAAYFLLDWLGREIGSRFRRGPFTFLSWPSDDIFHERVAQLLQELLTCGERWEQFRSELAACFRQPVNADGRWRIRAPLLVRLPRSDRLRSKAYVDLTVSLNSSEK
jgi:hypothetical protein